MPKFMMGRTKIALKFQELASISEQHRMLVQEGIEVTVFYVL
jgi:hypothetical protein